MVNFIEPQNIPVRT